MGRGAGSIREAGGNDGCASQEICIPHLAMIRQIWSTLFLPKSQWRRVKGVNRLVPLAHCCCKYGGFSTMQHDETMMLGRNDNAYSEVDYLGKAGTP